jgi:thiamine-monophosphate kinase
LALTLPNQDKKWLEGFSTGLKTLANEANIQLIGGDTTKGPLSISITAMGLAETKHLMLRSNAKHNDTIYVTGTLGDAAAGLAMVQQRYESGDNETSCIEKLNYPTPRNKESQIIRAYSNTCLDISDGFLADLNHILQASNSGGNIRGNIKGDIGAKVDLSNIPLSTALKQIDRQLALKYALSGGDDYELLFTVPKENQQAFEQCIQQEKLTCTAVGKIDTSVTDIISTENKVLNPVGYNHFKDIE